MTSGGMWDPINGANLPIVNPQRRLSRTARHRIRPSARTSRSNQAGYTGRVMIRIFRPIPLQKIKLLLFDLDGTLIDSENRPGRLGERHVAALRPQGTAAGSDRHLHRRRRAHAHPPRTRRPGSCRHRAGGAQLLPALLPRPQARQHGSLPRHSRGFATGRRTSMASVARWPC